MHPFQFEQDTIEELQNSISSIEAIELDALLRKDLPLGGYEKLQGVFELVRNSALDAKGLELSQAPAATIDEARQQVSRLEELFRRVLNQPIEGFSTQIVTAMRNDLETHWRTKLTPAIAALYPFALRGTFLKRRAVEVMEVIVKAENMLTRLENAKVSSDELWAKIAAEHAVNQEAAKKQVEEVERVMAALGTSHYADRFEKESGRQADAAKTWLHRLCYCGVALLACAAFFAWLESSNPTAGTSALVTATTWRVTLFFIISGAVFICIKNFSAAKHNQVINDHRANALATFNVFSNSTSDEETRKAVLLQAMQAIFSTQPSGYLKSGAEGQPSTQIVEFIKNTVTKD